VSEARNEWRVSGGS